MRVRVKLDRPHLSSMDLFFMNSRISVIALCLGVLNHPFVYCSRESIDLTTRFGTRAPRAGHRELIVN
jgi:hypothetical protein